MATLMRTKKKLCFVAILLLLPPGFNYAEEKNTNRDVTYFAIVKNHVFAQDLNGHIAETGYTFLAYIFVKPDSEISNAYLTIPENTAGRLTFPDFRLLDSVEKDTYLFIRSEKTFEDKEEYNKNYADGTYTVEFTTSAGDHRSDLKLEGGVYPQPAVITLFQSGNEVEPANIDPGRGLRVTWGGFPQGRSDPNGILDDVVFVIVKDCNGGKVLHSGRPYQGFHLLYSDKDYLIPANTMMAGRKYELIVDNGLTVDSNIEAGVPGVAFYAQTNKMPIYTAGQADNTDCISN